MCRSLIGCGHACHSLCLPRHCPLPKTRTLLLCAGTGELTHKQQFGDHYGGHHEGKDTFSHMGASSLVPNTKSDESITMLTGHHYGHGHEDKDTFDHFGVGMNLTAGEQDHTEVYGHHWKGHENKDTASHMEAGSLMPNRPLSFLTGANQLGDEPKAMVHRKGKKRPTGGSLPGTIAGQKSIQWQSASNR
jgi:hypothetical protein